MIDVGQLANITHQLERARQMLLSTDVRDHLDGVRVLNRQITQLHKHLEEMISDMEVTNAMR